VHPRFNQELKRRTRVVRIFPDRHSCLRLVSALAVEQSEEWLTGRRYLGMEELSEHRHWEKRAAKETSIMEREGRIGLGGNYRTFRT